MIRPLQRAAAGLVAGCGLLLTLGFGAGPAAAQEFLELKLQPSIGTIHRGNGLPGETLRVLTGADQVWLAASDLAALLEGTIFWRPEVQKLGFEVGGHLLAFSVGSEIVMLDEEESVHLPGPVFNREGQIFLPLAAFLDASGRPYPWIPVALRWDPAGKRLDLAAPRPGLTGVRFIPGPDGERLEIQLERPVGARVELAGRARTVVRLPDVAVDPDTLRLPTSSVLFLALTVESSREGAALSFATPGDILGYSLQRLERPARIVIELTNDPDAVRDRRFQPFPESGLADTLALAVVALDPGGGGESGGGGENGAAMEGDLSLDLARALARCLEDSLGVRVVLTRDDARPVPDVDRSERANTARADLFLSLNVLGDAGDPRAVIARSSTRRPTGVARPLAELGFESWGAGSRDTRDASRLLATLLVAELRPELAMAAPGRDGGGGSTARGDAAGSEPGDVLEWPVPLLQSVVMPAAYLVLDPAALSAGRASGGDGAPNERVVAAILRAIRRYRVSAP